SGNVTVELSPKSTAVALVYLTPFIARDNPAEQRGTLDLIASLPETDTLAGRIEALLRANIETDLLADHDLRDGIARVISVLLDRVAKQEPVSKLVILPGNASRISVSESADAGMCLVTNSGRRFVSAYVGTSGEYVSLPARAPLVNIGVALGLPLP